MFILELKLCPDQERIGTYTFYFPKIVVSRKINDCHLYLPDHSLKEQSLLVVEKSNGLEVSEKSNGFYLSNDKKISGKKIHHVGDSFGLGQCLLQIVSIVPSALDIDTESRYHELTEKHPYMADLFWALKQELLSLEKNEK